MGLAAADKQADLGAKIPSGLTVTVEPTGPAPVFTKLLASLDRAPFVGAPSVYHTTVDGKKAIYVQWTAAEKSGNETTRMIVVPVGNGQTYTLTFEAAAAKWTLSNGSLDSILASVKFS